MAALVQQQQDDNDNKNNTQSDAAMHNPDDILNLDFIDLFIEEAPPEWTMADLHALSAIKGLPPPTPAPFQQLPVEIIEHIALNLVHFRDIRAMANSCAFFRRILFDSGNHLFWYKWSKSPHSMCRWDLGYYRKNRAYQNTIVNQQNGKRRKRCEKCMARAVRGLAFKQKTCIDCWEDLGMPAHELFFLKNLDISKVPHEYVENSYLPSTEQSWTLRREWDLLYFLKPKLEDQLTNQFYVAQLSRPSKLLEFAKKYIRDMSSEVSEKKRNMSYKYSNYGYYGGSNVRKENWYVDSVQDLISPHEVIQRMLETAFTDYVGEDWAERCGYKLLESPEMLYGVQTPFKKSIGPTKCDLQTTEEYIKKYGEDPDHFHECDLSCQRKSKAKKFSEAWFPIAEQSLFDMLIGANCVNLSETEVQNLQPPGYSWQYRESMQKVIDKMLDAAKWAVPGVSGGYTQESLDKWLGIHGKGKAKAKDERGMKPPEVVPSGQASQLSSEELERQQQEWELFCATLV